MGEPDQRSLDKETTYLTLGVEVEECFLHRAKALVRSHLWETESWPGLTTIPTGAELLQACPKIGPVSAASPIRNPPPRRQFW